MKKIETLIDDIYGLFNSGHVPSAESLETLANNMKEHMTRAMAKPEPKGALRGSQIGEPCDRKSWYDVNKPDISEELPGKTMFKFLLGHLVEEIILLMAKEAGHTVSNRQQEVVINEVPGHIDAVIDGVLIDVKSTGGYGMRKFTNNGLYGDDPFGYLPQISFYKEGLKDDPNVSQDRIAFIAVDRQGGDLLLDVYREPELRERVTAQTGRGIAEEVARKKQVVSNSVIPPRGYRPEPDGASGNERLGVKCTYCNKKKECWPGMRTFVYSNGPRYLTKVVKEPNVPEEKE